jgi:transcriptional regulator with XRE-family HTH domain
MDNGTKTVIELLAKGLGASEIARMFDVTPSSVSQIKANYAEQIEAKRSDSTLAKVTNDTMLDKIERTLLEKIEEVLPHESDLRILGGMLKTINGAVRRSAGESSGVGSGKEVETAQLHLHASFIQNNITFKQDSQGQVVQVEGTNLNTASSDMVKKMAQITVDTTETHVPVTDKELLYDLFGTD